MWVTALIGMITKFSEIVLDVKYREKNVDGDYVGGPMYYLKNALKSKALGNTYAFLFMLTIVSGIMVQANSAAGAAVTLGLPTYVSGVIILIMVGLIVICTMTALVILTSGIWKTTDVIASGMTSKVFSDFYGPIGGYVVAISVLLFVISTIYVILFYGERLAEYLFGHTFSLVMRYVYLAACFAGAVGGLKFVWIFLDLLFGLSVIPNMIGVIALSGVVAAQTR